MISRDAAGKNRRQPVHFIQESRFPAEADQLQIASNLPQRSSQQYKPSERTGGGLPGSPKIDDHCAGATCSERLAINPLGILMREKFSLKNNFNLLCDHLAPHRLQLLHPSMTRRIYHG